MTLWGRHFFLILYRERLGCFQSCCFINIPGTNSLMQNSFLSCLIILLGGKKIPRIGIAELGICTFSKVVDPSCQKALWKTPPLCLPQQFKRTPVFHTLTHSGFHKTFQPSVNTFSGKHITLLLCLDLQPDWPEALRQGRNGQIEPSFPAHHPECLSPALLFQGRK